jgi:hypothetical protein
MADLDDEYAPHHPLEGLLPWGEDFPNHAMRLAGDLKMLISGDENCKFDEPELHEIDEYILENDDADTLISFINSNFMPMLLAYSGEYVKRRVDGVWSMVLMDDGKTWEPRIIGKDGESYLLVEVHDSLFEHRSKCSIFGSVLSIVRYPRR